MPTDSEGAEGPGIMIVPPARADTESAALGVEIRDPSPSRVRKCPQPECDALMALAHASGPENWTAY